MRLMTDHDPSEFLYTVHLEHNVGDILAGEIKVPAQWVVHVAYVNRLVGTLNKAYARGEIRPLSMFHLIPYPRGQA